MKNVGTIIQNDIYVKFNFLLNEGRIVFYQDTTDVYSQSSEVFEVLYFQFLYDL